MGRRGDRAAFDAACAEMHLSFSTGQGTSARHAVHRSRRAARTHSGAARRCRQQGHRGRPLYPRARGRGVRTPIAAYVGVKHAVACANGTDALLIPLMAKGIGPGDAVFCPSFTFAATAEVVALDRRGAGFRRYRSRYLQYGSGAAGRGDRHGQARRQARAEGRHSRSISSASPPTTARSRRSRRRRAVRGRGCGPGDRRPAGQCQCAAPSAMSAPPVSTRPSRSAAMATAARCSPTMTEWQGSCAPIAFHGKGESQYDNVIVGLNSRLDTIQAAILLEKLAILEEEMEMRQVVAARYSDGLRDVVKVPAVAAELPLCMGPVRHRDDGPGRGQGLSAPERRSVGRLLRQAAPPAARLQPLSVRAGRPAGFGRRFPRAFSAFRCIPISARRIRTASSG